MNAFVEPGFEATFPLADVLAAAHAALAADPHATIEIADDGRHLRIGERVLPSRQHTGGGPEPGMTWTAGDPLTYRPTRREGSDMEFLQYLGTRWVKFEHHCHRYVDRAKRHECWWSTSANPSMERREGLYSGPDRFVIQHMSGPYGTDAERCAILDTVYAIGYRAADGQARLQGPRRLMEPLADRLNALPPDAEWWADQNADSADSADPAGPAPPPPADHPNPTE
jgi:hypothetical protein